MTEGRVVTLVATYIVVAVLLVGGTALLGLAVGGTVGTPDGVGIEGQSPAQFQPDRVNPEVDPETGRIAVERGDARILVDADHGNQFEESDLEPAVEAAFRAGHTVTFSDAVDSDQQYNQTLAGRSGLLVVQPTEGFSAGERAVIRNFTAEGGHVVVFAEPTQSRVSTGLFGGGATTVSFGANNLTESYGVRIGAEPLFNVEDSANDNNFKSIYSSPRGDDPLTEGAETVTFDAGGYVVVRRTSDAEVVYQSVPGTRTLDSRRAGQYPTVARTENLVFVADTTLLERSEVYDADNEVFVGNLLSFLVSGDAPERLPGATETDGDGGGTNDGPTGNGTVTPTNETPTPST
ncbi:GldG family protein [Halomicroarcula sp. F13]|uniref:GldG family protein n=1 Tax=Haloarcula rubra TaxID=2487747 RepID=A0AAW4PZK4_9EURY|nr:GldG family protein [Halomicroarcula rubra]MBX0325692.1 GldG family protein [Halomicroarcula rubra]